MIGYSNLNIDQGLYYFVGDQDQFTCQVILFLNKMLLSATNVL